MKALSLTCGGSIENFKIQDLEIPTIGDNELLVKVHAVSLNPSDYQTAEYLNELSFPMVLGLDIAGKVVAVGKNVQNFKVGDRVFYLRKMDNPNGGFAEYSVTPAKFACKIPDSINDAQAAALPGAGMTAYHIMYGRLKPQKGKTILIHGGAGGVGSYLVQMAKLNGLKVITTCLGRDFDYVKRLGADVSIDFQNDDIYPCIMAATDNKGVDYIVNMVSSESATADFAVMRFGCELAVTAGLPNFQKWHFYEKGISIHEIAFGGFLSHPDEDLQRIPAQVAFELGKLVASNSIDTPAITEITLEQIPEYLRQIKEGKVFGKIVARVR